MSILEIKDQQIKKNLQEFITRFVKTVLFDIC